jgi:hypothetical protein
MAWCSLPIQRTRWTPQGAEAAAAPPNLGLQRPWLRSQTSLLDFKELPSAAHCCYHRLATPLNPSVKRRNSLLRA